MVSTLAMSLNRYTSVKYPVYHKTSLFFLFLDVAFLRLTSYVRPVCEYLLPLLKEPAFYLTPYFTLYLYSQLTKMLSTLFMNVNRYTSVNHPIKHKTIWMKYCSKSITAIFIIPAFFVWPVAIAQTSFLPINGQAVIVYDHLFSWARTTYARMIIAAVTLIFTVFSSIITSSKLRKLGKHMKSIEFSMNVATLFTSIGFILLLVMQVVYLTLHVETLVEKPWVRMLVIGGTQIGNDFYMLSGPVVLLILDKNIRRSTLSWKYKKNDSRRVSKISTHRSTGTH
uniref:Serpentine receptor class gamma n=2 Tax=Caenorhabditis tropicalis TaxID=1561998 RepID=A0A1I7UVR0_9PELO